MAEERTETNYLKIFTIFWSTSIISHQVQYGAVFGSFYDLLLTFLAIITLLKPNNYRVFLSLLFLQFFTIFIYLPNAYNHWFLSFFISLAIIINYLYVVLSSRTFNIDRENFCSNFVPVLRIILITVYFIAFIHKLNSDYFSPDVSCGVFMYLKLVDIYGFLPRGEAVNNFFIYISLLAEISIPLLLIFERTRIAGILLGLFTHLVFGIMGYLNFSIIMFALLSLYLPINFFKSKNVSGSKIFNYRDLNILKAAAYVITLILISLFVYNRTLYVVSDKQLILNILRIVFAIFSLILILFFINKLRCGDYKWPDNFFRINILNAILIFIFLLNCLSPYLGFKTQNVFSMYSNLRTENNRSNHLFGDKFTIGGYQKEIVEIKKSNVKKLINHKKVPFAQMENFIFEAFRKGKKEVFVEYIKNSETIYYKISGDSFMKNDFIPKFIKWKFFDFKPVSVSDKQGCGL